MKTRQEVPPVLQTTNQKQLVRLATPTETSGLTFPERGYIGVASKFAELYSRAYESPKEFFYVDLLVLIGTLISGRVRTDVDIDAQPRLYALKVAPSGWPRKSSSTQAARKFLLAALERQKASVHLDEDSIVSGVGSAEGLARVLSPRDIGLGLETTRRTTLIFDEFRRFESKARIEGSALRPAVNELYETNQYTNVIKSESIHVVDGHLGFLSNTTEENFQNLLDPNEAKDIGFLNRFFIVVGKSTKRIPRPIAPRREESEPIHSELAGYFAELPHLTIEGKSSEERLIHFTREAESIWDDWYMTLEQDETTVRLDTIGLRLMGLLAFTSGRYEIDVDLVRSVLAILEYERHVRTLYRPNAGTNPFARMEEKIRRALHRSPLSDRDLRRNTNADRDGLNIYNKAKSTLITAKEIVSDPKNKTYKLVENK